jgi:hypothetical protein
MTAIAPEVSAFVMTLRKKRRPIGRLDSLCEVVSVNFVDHHALSGVDQIGAIFAVDVAVVAQ